MPACLNKSLHSLFLNPLNTDNGASFFTRYDLENIFVIHFMEKYANGWRWRSLIKKPIFEFDFISRWNHHQSRWCEDSSVWGIWTNKFLRSNCWKFERRRRKNHICMFHILKWRSDFDMMLLKFHWSLCQITIIEKYLYFVFLELPNMFNQSLEKKATTIKRQQCDYFHP